jgi:RNA polymerase sigma-70 factor (sigma-E family)
MAQSLASNRADAEDLLQAALLKTYFAWDRIHTPQARDGYVRRAMKNTQISQWRQRKLDVYPTDEIPESETEDPSWKVDLADVVERAVAQLPDRQRTTVRLRYFDDLSEAEIASRLGITIGTVKSTVSRAVARLRLDVDLARERGITLAEPPEEPNPGPEAPLPRPRRPR